MLNNNNIDGSIPAPVEGGVFEEINRKHFRDFLGGLVPIHTLLKTGSAGDDTLDGTNADDVLSGVGGNDQLNGKDGNDVLEGGAGADKLDGGNGIDTADYSDATSYIGVILKRNAGFAGDAVGDSFTSIENVGGSKFNDQIGGDDGDNKLYGRDGDDYLTGGLGKDLLDGGSGKDAVSYGEAASAVVADLGSSAINTGEAAGDIYVSIESVVGSVFNDILRGNSEDNFLNGYLGDDILVGGKGADSFRGDDGFDTISYSTATVGVVADLGDSKKNTEDAAGDQYESVEALEGSSFSDELTGDDSGNTLTGLAGNDVLVGGKGNDLLDGGLGADILDGGEGWQDTVTYERADVGVRVDLHDSRNNGGGAAGDILRDIEDVIGSNFDDVLISAGSDSFLIGGKGNDRFDGSDDGFSSASSLDGRYLRPPLRNIFDGGDDFDTVTYASATAGVTVNLKDSNKNAGVASNDAYNSIEAVEGSAFADTLVAATGGTELHGLAGKDTLTGDAGNDTLYGGMDDDTLSGSTGADRLYGGAGSDALDGGAGSDTVSYEDAAAGIVLDLVTKGNSTGDAKGDSFKDIEIFVGSSFNDTMRGTTGNDNFEGGKGDDLLSGDAGNDHLDGGAGKDWLEGGAGDDDLTGDKGDDTLIGRLGDDLLMGGDGKDSLYGSEGNDTLNGNVGEDMLSGGADNDILNGGSEDDTEYGGQGDDKVNGDDGNDVLSGGTGNDTLMGGNNDDKLYGNEDDDALFAGAGEDLLFGGQGHDTLTGEAGADTFVLRLGDNEGGPLSAADVITDYVDGVDKLGLADKLQFKELVFTEQDVDKNGTMDVVISHGTGATTEYLAVVMNATKAQFDPADAVEVV